MINFLLDMIHRAERTIIMGVLNITPDSFSDGGLFFDESRALTHAERMLADGADIIDVGGESTRPGSVPISAEEEVRRTLPVVTALSQKLGAIVSIDTNKAVVADLAVAAGAKMINDISALRMDPGMAAVAAQSAVPICLMHMRSTPKDMQVNPEYVDVIREIEQELSISVSTALEAGVERNQIILDPGFGFGKTVEHNLEIIRRLVELKRMRFPLLVGTSRKSTIGAVLGGLPPEERLEGTAATVALCIANGAAIVRVHDVKEMARVARMTDAIVRHRTTPTS